MQRFNVLSRTQRAESPRTCPNQRIPGEHFNICFVTLLTKTAKICGANISKHPRTVAKSLSKTNGCNADSTFPFSWFRGSVKLTSCSGFYACFCSSRDRAHGSPLSRNQPAESTDFDLFMMYKDYVKQDPASLLEAK